MKKIYMIIGVVYAISIVGCATSSKQFNIQTTATKKLTSDAVNHLQREIYKDGCKKMDGIKTTPLVLGASSNTEYWEVVGCGQVYKYELTFATDGSAYSLKKRD